MLKDQRRCTQCTKGKIFREGRAFDGRPQYKCSNCEQTHTNGRQGYGWDKSTDNGFVPKSG